MQIDKSVNSQKNEKEIKNPPPKKAILVLGSGLVSEPCVNYLLKREENNITR